MTFSKILGFFVAVSPIVTVASGVVSVIKWLSGD